MSKKVYYLIPCYGPNEPIKETLDLLESSNIANTNKIEVIILATPDENENIVDSSKFNTYSFEITIITEKRRGYGRAYKTGFEYLKKNGGEEYFVITSDADATYPLDLSSELLSIFMASKRNFISVGRLKLLLNNSMSLRNLIGNRLLTLATEFLFFIKMNDSQSGMWIFDKKFVNTVDLNIIGNGMEFSTQIKLFAIRHKLIKYGELEAPYYPRAGNEPQLRWFRDALRVSFNILKFRFRRVS